MESTRRSRHMKFDKLKKAVVTLALAMTCIMGLGIGDNAQAQSRRDWDRHDRARIERFERERLDRIRRLDFQRRLRYQYFRGNRIVGYHDRWGHFHRYGWYDGFGRLHIY